MSRGVSFFDGLAEDDLRWVLERLDRRTFAAGETMLAEGDAPSEIYVIEDGSVDVLMTDARGAEHKLNTVGPGGSLGEMSVFSGRPVSATVRAASDTTVYVIGKTDFRRIGSMYPQLYENLGSMLAARLVEADHRHVHEERARVALVEDAGGPPLAAYALACSIAWHAVEPTLLVLGPGAPTDERLEGLEPPDGDLQPRAYVVDATGDPTAAAAITARPEFKHVLVLQHEGAPPPHTKRIIRLAGPHDSVGGGRAEYAVRAFVDGAARGNRVRDGFVDVPPLNAEDESALRDGILPVTTPAGRALGSAARNLADLEVGVALGSGAIRGWAHVGALQGLLEAGVPIDYIAGTSIGAVVASGYSVGMNIEEITQGLHDAATRLFKLRLPRGALLSPSGFKSSLTGSLGDTLIEETLVPIAVTAVDILGQREVVLREGLLWQAVLASAAIPGVFPPQHIGEQVLVDGGVLNPVPSNVVSDMGASIQIGVKLTRRSGAKMRMQRRPRLFDIFTSTFELMQSKISTDAAAASTLLVEPTFENQTGFGLRSFDQGRQFIPNGYDSVETALPRIHAALPWMRRREAVAVH
ncbi:MAG TPA: patatin-like phospholipase family protein [Gaiellaceae bacterium]|nr:patatin-like phospholipase family protein [Gaiellaceae bacterium]